MKRANAFAEWTMTFGLLLAGLAFVNSLLKGNFQNKGAVTAEYLLWRQWGQTPNYNIAEITSRLRSRASQQVQGNIREEQGRQETELIQSLQDDRVTSNVEEGASIYLETFDLKDALE